MPTPCHFRSTPLPAPHLNYCCICGSSADTGCGCTDVSHLSCRSNLQILPKRGVGHTPHILLQGSRSFCRICVNNCVYPVYGARFDCIRSVAHPDTLPIDPPMQELRTFFPLLELKVEICSCKRCSLQLGLKPLEHSPAGSHHSLPRRVPPAHTCHQSDYDEEFTSAPSAQHARVPSRRPFGRISAWWHGSEGNVHQTRRAVTCPPFHHWPTMEQC